MGSLALLGGATGAASTLTLSTHPETTFAAVRSSAVRASEGSRRDVAHRDGGVALALLRRRLLRLGRLEEVQHRFDALYAR